MKYILSLTILLLAFTRSSNAVLFITCDGDATDCCCSEIYATDCYCAPTCPSDTYRIVSNFSAFLRWPSAAADSTSDLTLTASVKDGICVNSNGPGWESVDRTTTTLKRDCTLYGTLGNTIYYTNSSGHNVEVNNSQSFVECTPSQKTITVQKSEHAHAYAPPSQKLYNQSNINDVTTVEHLQWPGTRTGIIALGMGYNIQYDFKNNSNNRCYAYYVPYRFNLVSPNILEYFNFSGAYNVADVLSIVTNNKLLRTYKGTQTTFQFPNFVKTPLGDITSYGRVFYGYGQNESKVDYCKDNNISNIHQCTDIREYLTDCGSDIWSTTENIPFTNNLLSGTNHIYLIYAIKRQGGGQVQLNYKFKDDVSVRFLENE